MKAGTSLGRLTGTALVKRALMAERSKLSLAASVGRILPLKSRELISTERPDASLGLEDISALVRSALITESNELSSADLVGSTLTLEGCELNSMETPLEKLTGRVSGRLDCSLIGRLDERPGCELTG